MRGAARWSCRSATQVPRLTLGMTALRHPEIARIKTPELRLRPFRVAQIRFPRVELLVGADGEVDRVRDVLALHVVAREHAAVDRVLAVEEGVAQVRVFSKLEDRCAELAHLIG